MSGRCPMGAPPPPRRTAPPVKMPPGFKAPYDAFEPRFDAARTHLMFALLGIENRGGDASALRRRLRGTLEGPDAPEIVEHGRVRRGYGPDAELWFAYWRSVGAYEDWCARPDVRALWDDDALLEGEFGLWREAGAISLDHNETSFSRDVALTGLVHLSDAIAITERHAYWGSARDRLVAAVDDALHPDPAAMPPHPPPGPAGGALGRRVLATAPRNLCFIRTSQDIAGATQEQAAVYRDEMEPVLMDAVRFLREDGRSAGCLGMRFIEECDEEGRFLGRTCGTGFFRSLADLEAWTHTHPTHEAIMGSFMTMVGRFQGAPGLHLWHEVTVFPAGTLTGLYINCTGDGGFL